MARLKTDIKVKQKKAKKSSGSRQPSGTGPVEPTIRRFIPAMLPVLLCLIVYYNSLSHGFVYDDYGVIVENKYISQTGGLFKSLFSQSYFEFSGLEASYRPVSTISYFLMYAAAELDPFFYHLVSLLLHMLNTLLVFRLAVLIFQDRLRAMMSSLLFACHPVLTETVNCIAWNDDLLTTLFFLLALIFYIRTRSDSLVSGIRGYSLSFLFFALGLLSKEMAITLPAVVLLYDLLMREADREAAGFEGLWNTVRSRISVYAGYAAISLLFLYVRFFVIYSPQQFRQTSAGSLLERIIYLPGHIFSFISLTLLPFDLNADHMFSYSDGFFDVRNLAGLLICLSLMGSAVYIYRYSKPVFFGIGWFFITLMPVYNLYEIYHPLAERYLYLPIIGFCLVLTAVLNGIGRKISSRSLRTNPVIWIPVAVIVVIYSFATIVRNPVWRSNYTLWSNTVQKSPDSFTARGGLGMAYLSRNRLDEAAEQFLIAIQLHPGSHKNFYNLGLVYHKKGDLKKALENFSRSAELNPASVNAHYNLATIYLQQRLWNPAIRHYRKVNELDPSRAMAYYNLGMAYAMQGQLESAVSAWENVLLLEPHNQMAKKNIRKARKMMEEKGG